MARKQRVTLVDAVFAEQWMYGGELMTYAEIDADLTAYAQRLVGDDWTRQQLIKNAYLGGMSTRQQPQSCRSFRFGWVDGIARREVNPDLTAALDAYTAA